MTTKAKRRKRCADCNVLCDPDDLDFGRCERCDDYYYYCRVCNDKINEDDDHRHVSWVNGHGWCGCGGDWFEPEHHRDSVWGFLDALAAIPQERLIYGIIDYGTATFDELLERFIGADNFWTFTHGFMMSTPTIDFRHLVRKDFSCPFLCIRPDDVDAMQRPELSLGWAWLSSLCADETKAANATTVGWIREWRQFRKGPTP